MSAPIIPLFRMRKSRFREVKWESQGDKAQHVNQHHRAGVHVLDTTPQLSRRPCVRSSWWKESWVWTVRSPLTLLPNEHTHGIEHVENKIEKRRDTKPAHSVVTPPLLIIPRITELLCLLAKPSTDAWVTRKQLWHELVAEESVLRVCMLAL